MLKMYQEREAIIRIRARIDAQVSQAGSLQGDELDADETSPWDGPRVQLGSSDRLGRRLATEFIAQYMKTDPSARQMARDLRTFLYQRVDGFARGDRNVFRERDLPLLDGMLVGIASPAVDFYNNFLPFCLTGFDL